MDIYLLPDTNILLHFPPLADIDWLDLSKTQSATIVIAPVISRELNDHKDAPRSRILRDRAARTLKDLHSRFKGLKSTQIRSNVQLLFLPRDPILDFSQYGLVRDLNDDWLIATALQMKTENPSTRVAVVTSDFGLQVKATVHVDVIEMPESLRLPEEVDAAERKIQELEGRLRRIRSEAPELRLTFPTGHSFGELQLHEFDALTPAMKAEQLETARREHPKIPLKSPEEGLASVIAQTVALANLAVEPYNRRIEEYYRNLSAWHEEFDRITTWYKATAKVDLLIGNSGGAPAEDIDITIHFPDGFEVLDEEDIPELPKPPKAPGTPEEEMSKMFQVSFPNIRGLSVPDIRIPQPMNVQLLGIKKTNSHEVNFLVRRLKHHKQEELPLIYLHFTSPPVSFRAEYRIVAANVPRPIEGTLDFIYKPLNL